MPNLMNESRESTGAESAPGGKNILILVEADEPRSLMKGKLERVGYVVTAASSTEQAVAYLGLWHFDLVVIEIAPEHQRDVVGMVTQVKAAMTAVTPLLAIAAVTPGGRVHSGLLSVATLSMLAPYHTVELIRAVERALGTHSQ